MQPTDSSPQNPCKLPPWAEPLLGGSDGQGIKVAVIDSGYQQGEKRPPWLDTGHGLVDPENELRYLRTDNDHDHIGHGTACCQIIHRMAPAAQMVPLKVFGQRLETSPEIILEALGWAIDNGCHLINLSLGTQSAHVVRPMYRLCEQAHDQGIVIVSAIPRGGEVSYPALFEPVLSVTLGDFEDPFDFEITPDEAAEVRAYSHHLTWWQGEERQVTGSSFAAPHITGIVARLLEKEPRQGLPAVRRALTELATERVRCQARGRRI